MGWDTAPLLTPAISDHPVRPSLGIAANLPVPCHTHLSPATPISCHTHLLPATPTCPLPHPPVSLTLPTPQLTQTSPPSPTSPLPTTPCRCLPHPPIPAKPSVSQLSSMPPTPGTWIMEDQEPQGQVPGEGTARGAGTYRSQGAPSPRCCHRAWCARSGPRAGPGARCGALMKICCWGSQIPPARCRSSCAGRGPAGPEPGWLQRTSLGDEVTADKREDSVSPTWQVKAKGGVTQPDPSPSPQSHPDQHQAPSSQEPPTTCREHAVHSPCASPNPSLLPWLCPSLFCHPDIPCHGRMALDSSPPHCPHSAGSRHNPRASRGHGHPKPSLMASTEPQPHPPSPASSESDPSSHPQDSPPRVTPSTTFVLSTQNPL